MPLLWVKFPPFLLLLLLLQQLLLRRGTSVDLSEGEEKLPAVDVLGVETEMGGEGLERSLKKKKKDKKDKKEKKGKEDP
jgi:hypothetical protein